MTTKANVTITITIAPEYALVPQSKCQKNDIYQRLTQRFLEDCKLHEISLGLEQLQHLTEVFLEKSLRIPQHSGQLEQKFQKNHKPIELTFPIDEDLFDVL